VYKGERMKEFIVNALPGMATALIASYLAARWSLRRFYSEKWWVTQKKK
jgi:hypothetical protein